MLRNMPERAASKLSRMKLHSDIAGALIRSAILITIAFKFDPALGDQISGPKIMHAFRWGVGLWGLYIFTVTTMAIAYNIFLAFDGIQKIWIKYALYLLAWVSMGIVGNAFLIIMLYETDYAIADYLVQFLEAHSLRGQ